MIRRALTDVAELAATVATYLFPVVFPRSLDGPSERAEQKRRNDDICTND